MVISKTMVVINTIMMKNKNMTMELINIDREPKRKEIQATIFLVYMVEVMDINMEDTIMGHISTNLKYLHILLHQFPLQYPLPL